jgi:WD40 repeat protein
MTASSLGHLSLASALRRWRGLRPKARATLALLAIAMLIGIWSFLLNQRDPWPARAILKTPLDTWPLAFSPDGRAFLTSGEGGITTWEVATGRKKGLWAVEGDRSAVGGIFSPNGRTFAAAAYSRSKPLAISLIDTDSGRTRATLSTQFRSVYALRFADDGRTIRAFLGDGKDLKEVVTWDAETGQEVSNRPLTAPTKAGITTISADGRTMAIGPNQALAVQLWDLDADRPLGSVMNTKSTSVVSWGGIGLTPDGRSLAVAREDGTIELWDVPTRSLRRTLAGNRPGFTSSGLRFSPDGRTLAADSRYRPVTSLGQISEGIRRSLVGRRQVDAEVADAEVIVMDLATGERLARAPTAIHPHYSPDGRTIATRERDLSVKLRDLPDSTPGDVSSNPRGRP